MTTLRMRLAMRHEGLWWNAYLARTETMNGAIHLGSIRMTLVQDEAVKAAFMESMKLAMTVAAKAASGLDMAWPDPPRPAPESERGGNA